jgi:hypothetical protein
MDQQEEPKPQIEHAYLQTGSGEPLKFWRLTDQKCPACSKGPHGSPLAVLAETFGQETLHCIYCDYQITQRPKPKFRPMNSGNR